MAATALDRQEAGLFLQRFIGFINSHDLDGILSLYGDDPVEFSPAIGHIRGREEVRNGWAEIFERFPDVQVELDKLVMVDANRLLFTGMTRATDNNGWFGQAPTHAPFEYRSFVLIDLENGKIVRSERMYDLSSLMKNLEKTRVDQELQLAAEVQRALLSRTERITKFCEAAGDSLPCRSIGGDFFEFFPLANGSFGVMLGDVSGKGPASALLAATIQGMMAIEVQGGHTPSQVLAHLNAALLRLNLQPRFATLAYGILSPDGTFTYSNAGQNPPLVLSDGEAYPLIAGGCILGAFPGFDFPQETVQLQDGDAVIFYSDGVTEAENELGDPFSELRIEQAAGSKQDAGAGAMVRAIFHDVKDHCHSTTLADDATVAVVRFVQPS